MMKHISLIIEVNGDLPATPQLIEQLKQVIDEDDPITFVIEGGNGTHRDHYTVHVVAMSEDD